MAQIWINLINNAIDYSTDEACIHLSMVKMNNRAIIKIKDQGPGIAKEDHTRIFQKYYRIEKNNNVGSHNGLGLGLSIVKRIIDLCGGTIELESSEGQGTLFIVELPFGSNS